MTIVEQALERAKRSQAQKPAAPGPAVPAPVAPVRERHERAAASSQSASALPVFPAYDYDPVVCEQNRILLGDDPAGTAMRQQASVAFRMLRARLLQKARNNGWSKIALTSPGPDEGKSSTALNLALSISREGNNDVFLIDLDMHKPSVCRYLGIAPRTEIGEFFAGKAAAEGIFFGLRQEKLIVAGGMHSVPNSSELLATGRLEELLSYIARISSRPFVIIDLPPVLHTDDALVVLPVVDATLLVVAEGKTRRDGLARALEVLGEFTVAGIAMNRTRESITTGYEPY